MADHDEPLPPLPSTLSGAIGRPFWLESRAPLELARLRVNPVPLAEVDGRRAVIVTGYLASPLTAKPLKDWLTGAGYRVTIADVGRNATSSSAAVDKIVQALHADGGDPAVLIGHSRGGQQSRVVAQRHPELVSQLITLASPVRAHLPRAAILRGSVEMMKIASKLPFAPDDRPDDDDDYEQQLLGPFGVDVPWTSIWSKVDGVVEWQACLDVAANSAEVRTSHTGMIASVPSYRVIARVLES